MQAAHNTVATVQAPARAVPAGPVGHNSESSAPSRILRVISFATFAHRNAGDSRGYQLFTVDHEDGSLRLDLAHAWAETSPPQPVLPQDQLLCDPLSVGVTTFRE